MCINTSNNVAIKVVHYPWVGPLYKKVRSLKYHLDKKFINNKVRLAWYGPVIFSCAVSVLYVPAYINGTAPPLFLMALIFIPIMYGLIRHSIKDAKYWNEYGEKIAVETLDDRLVYHDSDGNSELLLSEVKDIKLEFKRKKLIAIHLITKSGKEQALRGYMRIENIVMFLRVKFPELASNV